MTQDTSINIGDHFEEFTSDLVQQGRFSTVSEAVRAGLELLEAQELKVKALRQAIEDGETSGFPDAPFDFDGFFLRMQEKYGPQV